MEIGEVLWDMHEGGRFARVLPAVMVKEQKAGRTFEYQCFMEWQDEPSEVQNSMFYQYIQATIRRHNPEFIYINKLLVVIAAGPMDDYDETAPNWMVAAYAYDGYRSGMCLVRRR